MGIEEVCYPQPGQARTNKELSIKRLLEQKLLQMKQIRISISIQHFLCQKYWFFIKKI